MLNSEYDKHCNQPSTIIAKDNLREVDGAKKLKLGSTGDVAKGLALGKASDSLEEINGVGRLELGEIGDGADQLGLSRAGDSGVGGNGAVDGGGSNGGVSIGRVGGGGGSNGKRCNIGAPEKSSPSGLI